MMEMIEIHLPNAENGRKQYYFAGKRQKMNGGDGANALHYLHHSGCNCLKMRMVLSFLSHFPILSILMTLAAFSFFSSTTFV